MKEYKHICKSEAEAQELIRNLRKAGYKRTQKRLLGGVVRKLRRTPHLGKRFLNEDTHPGGYEGKNKN